MNNLLDFFFKLGDKATGGDIKRKANYDFIMLWVIFLAFFGVFIGNALEFFKTQAIANLGWALFGLAIMWFQYFGLKQMYEYRKLLNSNPEPDKVESPEEMLDLFKK